MSHTRLLVAMVSRIIKTLKGNDNASLPLQKMQTFSMLRSPWAVLRNIYFRHCYNVLSLVYVSL